VRFELQGFAPIDRSDIPVRVAVVTTVDQQWGSYYYSLQPREVPRRFV
jgi:hypothetical protein